ncbi:MAG: M20/M25/M40 family metallo-hydrolase [Chitinophagaceae bacterium]
MQNKLSVKLYPILFLVLTIIVTLFSTEAVCPPGVVKSNASDTIFSAQRSYIYLQQIARMPHSVGTAEHERVKNYIITTCRKLGLTVNTQNTTVLSQKGDGLIAIYVQNIIAQIKGRSTGKAILNVAHYDSQPNTPGAADDGIGVAAMLECARAIKALPAMQNDITFLFSDGEEQGLFGAKAFTEKVSLSKNIGIGINWDCRGNKGITITYETSSSNGWIMRQYAKGIKYPVANSMGYEISRRMPNDADFTYLKKAGITGFTNGLLGGYSNYHSMTDSPENLDMKSLQHVGDNMLSITKQIGNIPLQNTKAPDLSYFNLYGFWFIHYPSSWNIYLIIATTILFIAVFLITIRKNQIRLWGFIAGTIALPVTLIITYFFSSFIVKKILTHYPLYSHFYENNSYNSGWYFLSMTMLALGFFSLIYQPILRKWGYPSSFTGILLCSVGGMWASQVYTPSASWLFFIPLLFLLAGYLWLLLTKKENDPKGFGYFLVRFISILPAILLFSPLTYFMFLSFGLGNNMPVVTMLVAFIAALLYPVVSSVFKSNKWLVPVLSFGFLFIFLLIAHLNSGYDEKHPLKTNVMYQVNTSDSVAVWLSDFLQTDGFSNKFFPDRVKDTTIRKSGTLIHAAPFLPYTPPNAVIINDTIYQDKRELTILCSATRNDVNNMGIVFDDSTSNHVQHIEINDKAMNPQNKNARFLKRIFFYGVPQQGFLIKLITSASTKSGFKLFDRSMGLPLIKNLTEYPAGFIPGSGFTSNTTQVEKHFVL